MEEWEDSAPCFLCGGREELASQYIYNKPQHINTQLVTVINKEKKGQLHMLKLSKYFCYNFFNVQEPEPYNAMF